MFAARAISLTPPARAALDEQIAETILHAVIAGELPIGEPLPPERELAEQLSVNRTSLRQALARLEQMGLVRSRQGSGNVVQDPSTLTDPAVVRVLAQRIGPELLDELLELRSALGSLMGRLAAERATDAEMEVLSQLFAMVVDADESAQRQASELAFFGALATATHNRPLLALTRWVAATYGVAPEGFTAAFDDANAVLEGLERILKAVHRRQGVAAGRAVEAYLVASGERLTAAAAAVRDRTNS